MAWLRTTCYPLVYVVTLGSNLSVGGLATFVHGLVANHMLSVGDVVTLGSNLSVGGLATFDNGLVANHMLSVGDVVTLGSNLSVGGLATFDHGLVALNDVIIGQNLLVGGYTTLTSTLSVGNMVTLGSNLSVGGHTTFGDEVSLGSNILVSGELSVTGAVLVGSDLAVRGVTTLDDRLFVLDDVTFGSNLSVGGVVSFEGGVSMGDKLSVNEEVTFGSNLYVGGWSLLDGDVLVNSILSIGDMVTMDSSLSIGGITTLGDRLFVVDEVSLGSNLSVSGWSSFDERVSMNKTLSVGDEVTFGSNLLVGGWATMDGDMVLNGTLSVIGNTSLASNLSVSGVSYMSGDVYMGSSLYAKNVFVESNMQLEGMEILDTVLIHNDLIVENNVTTQSNLYVGGVATFVEPVIMQNALHITGNVSASNIQTSNLNVLTGLTFDGDYTVQGNLEVVGDLTINNTTFPLVPNSNDITKVLAVNDSNNYELMTLFHSHSTCEFKSLFGVFETGTELEVVSGVFDFGVPKYWLSGWTGKLFDGVEYTTDAGVLAPDGSNVDMDSLELIEDLATSNMDFKDFINISMYKTNGKKLNKIAGIAVNDFVSPNYYFFLGTIDPNHEFFKYKFKLDFEKFYSDLPNMSYGSNYGYRVDLDSIRVRNKSLHTQGTNMFVVEFINTYDRVGSWTDTSYKFNKAGTIIDRKNSFYLIDSSGGTVTLKAKNMGLYPHLTYKRWRNSSKPAFYEKKYEQDIGWGSSPNINDIYNLYHNDDNETLKKLYKLTYNYIKNGLTETNDLSDAVLDGYYNTNVVNVVDHNMMMHSNLNNNDNYIEGSINAVTFTNAAFPNEILS
uniref:Uncharacterized protein n=1 Tax=Pyramimonas orientalis virus TaxID=455367 RepID=A0A7L9AXR2_POV01|nr:hypothetical protein HWQ62_00272 [Pyramimonas orientalis virus]